MEPNTPTPITRFEAHSRGLRRFYTGKPCARGHVAERYTSNGGCVRCLLQTVPNPAKTQGFQFLPARAMGFGLAPRGVPTEQQAQAVFRAIEAWGWHYKVLELLLDNPEKMAEFDHEPTLAEKIERQNKGL